MVREQAQACDQPREKSGEPGPNDTAGSIFRPTAGLDHLSQTRAVELPIVSALLHARTKPFLGRLKLPEIAGRCPRHVVHSHGNRSRDLDAQQGIPPEV